MAFVVGFIIGAITGAGMLSFYCIVEVEKRDSCTGRDDGHTLGGR